MTTDTSEQCIEVRKERPTRFLIRSETGIKTVAITVVELVSNWPVLHLNTSRFMVCFEYASYFLICRNSSAAADVRESLLQFLELWENCERGMFYEAATESCLATASPFP